MRLSNFLEQQTNSNATQVTAQLIKRLKIPVTTSTIVESIEHHPDYPSLYSISDSLAKWKIENLALKVESEKMGELPAPFIAHDRWNGGKFVLVSAVGGSVEYIDENGKKREKSREAFEEEWDNVVLLAEKNERSGDKNYGMHRRKEIMDALRIPLIAAACFLLSLLDFLLFPGVLAGFLLLLKLAGTLVTGLLLWFEIDKFNPVVQQICSAGKKTNCTAVLNSSKAKLFNRVSWSEIGFFYFAGGFLFLLFTAGHQESALPIVRWLNLMALPYTVFSVVYQWRVAKQWCPLCLAVQLILVLECLAFYFSSPETSRGTQLSATDSFLLVASFLLPVFFWTATKRKYLLANEAKQLKKELSRMKYNREIFDSILQRQKPVSVSTEGLGITLGNPNARHSIIKVCNPFCGPCAAAHPVIDQLLDSNEEIKVQIIFNAGSDEHDLRGKPVRHFMALYEKHGGGLIRKALDDWYLAPKKDYEAFSRCYPVGDELQRQGPGMNAMKKWCDDMQISFTPTIFVDGYQLPEFYKTADLKYLFNHH